MPPPGKGKPKNTKTEPSWPQAAPLVAIVGRPNVGKSTLFNRFIGKRHAIIAEEAGTTRDRIFHPCQINDFPIILADTGGLEDQKSGMDIEDNIQVQAQIAIHDADLILFIVDGAHNLTIDDFAAANILRKSSKKVLLVVNKCDQLEMCDSNLSHVYELGFPEPIKISAIHKLGIDELKFDIEKQLKELGFKNKPQKTEKAHEHLNICFVGRPNVGKSSFVNALLGQKKIIVSDIPGTTRDAIDTPFTFNEKEFNLIDTAGLRRRGKIERGIEKFSSLRSLAAIERTDIACLLIDGKQGIVSQDCHVAEYILEQNKGLILVINKIDLFEEEEEQTRRIRQLQRRFSFLPWAPVVLTSALKKKNITKVLEIALQIKEQREKRIPTPELNKFLEQVAAKHHLQGPGSDKPKIYYGAQVAINPPEFALVINKKENFHFSYMRYLENQIRDHYGFTGTAIKLSLKTRNNRMKIKEWMMREPKDKKKKQL